MIQFSLPNSYGVSILDILIRKNFKLFLYAYCYFNWIKDNWIRF